MTDESKLIFIISQPRSGSTLLQKLISNNPLVDTVSEPWLLLPLLSVYKPGLIDAKYNYPVALKGFFDYLGKKNAADDFRAGLKKLVMDLYKTSDANHFFVDKTPRYYEMIPEIREMFPNAKFLVLKRNPFASLHSMLSTWAGGKADYSLFSTFFRDFLVAPFLIQEFCDKYGEDKGTYIVKYEDIVSDPGKAVKEMYDWLKIPFAEEVLELGKNEKVKGIYGDDVYREKPLQEIKPGLTDAWRESLSNKEIQQLYAGYEEFLSGDFIRRYGYSPENFKSADSLFRKNAFRDYVSSLKKTGQI